MGTWPEAHLTGITTGAVSGKIDAATLQPALGSGATTARATI
jgi:hypothetical protein